MTNELSKMIGELKPSECKILLWLLSVETDRHHAETTRHRVDQPAIQLGTRLSPPTIKRALGALTARSLIVWKNGYRVSENFFTGQKKLFSIYDDVGTVPSLVQQQHHNGEKVFASAKDSQGRTISGNVLDWLVKNIGEKVALAWAAWIPAAPEEYSNPIGFMVSCLRVNQEQMPPIIVVKSDLSIGATQNRWMIHGTQEHETYCRDHPDMFDCNCLDAEPAMR